MDIKSFVLNYVKLQLMLALRDNRKQPLIYYKGKVTYIQPFKPLDGSHLVEMG